MFDVEGIKTPLQFFCIKVTIVLLVNLNSLTLTLRLMSCSLHSFCVIRELKYQLFKRLSNDFFLESSMFKWFGLNVYTYWEHFLSLRNLHVSDWTFLYLERCPKIGFMFLCGRHRLLGGYTLRYQCALNEC